MYIFLKKFALKLIEKRETILASVISHIILYIIYYLFYYDLFALSKVFLFHQNNLISNHFSLRRDNDTNIIAILFPLYLRLARESAIAPFYI